MSLLYYVIEFQCRRLLVTRRIKRITFDLRIAVTTYIQCSLRWFAIFVHQYIMFKAATCILLEHLDEPSSAWYNYWMLNLLFSIISFYESLLLFTFSMYIQNCRIENRTSVLCRRGSCPIVRPRTRFGFHTRFGICLKLDSGNSEECMRLPRSCSFCFSFVFPLR